MAHTVLVPNIADPTGTRKGADPIFLDTGTGAANLLNAEGPRYLS